MKTTFLDFEQPIAELESKMEELRNVQETTSVDLSQDLARLQKKSQSVTKEIYGKLGAWQISQVARHPQRPYSLDYLNHIFTDFQELHGDRAYADDPAIVGGLARFDGQSADDGWVVGVGTVAVEFLEIGEYDSGSRGNRPFGWRATWDICQAPQFAVNFLGDALAFLLAARKISRGPPKWFPERCAASILDSSSAIGCSKSRKVVFMDEGIPQ